MNNARVTNIFRLIAATRVFSMLSNYYLNNLKYLTKKEQSKEKGLSSFDNISLTLICVVNVMLK